MFQFLDLIRDFSILSIYKKSRRKENNQNTTWKKNEGWFQDFKLQKFCEMLFWKVNYYNPKLCREKLVLLYSYVIVNLYPRCYRYKRFFSSFYYRNYTISNAFLSWGSSTNHVDSRGGRGVPKMSMFVHMGGGGV